MKSLLSNLIIQNRNILLPARKSLAGSKIIIAKKLGITVRSMNRYLTAGTEKRQPSKIISAKILKLYDKEFDYKKCYKKGFKYSEFKKVKIKMENVSKKKAIKYHSLKNIIQTNYTNRDKVKITNFAMNSEKDLLNFQIIYRGNGNLQGFRAYKILYNYKTKERVIVSKIFVFTDTHKQKQKNIVLLQKWLRESKTDKYKVIDIYLQLQEYTIVGG